MWPDYNYGRVLQSSENEIESGTADLFAVAQKRLKVEMKSNAETGTHKLWSAALADGSSSDDDNVLSSIFDKSQTISGTGKKDTKPEGDDGEEDDGKKPSKGSTRKRLPSGSPASASKRERALASTDPVLAGVSSKKAFFEMDTAEQVVLFVEQTVKTFSENSTFLTVTLKSLDSLMDKVKARLGIESIKILNQDGNPRGIAILQKLRDGT